MPSIKEYASLYEPIMKDDISDYFYTRVTDAVIAWLEKERGMQNENYLLDLGDQIIYGGSFYWDLYVDTIRDLIEEQLKGIPNKFLWVMWRTKHTWYQDDDEIYEDEEEIEESEIIENIVTDIWNEICCRAEEAYEEKENEENKHDDNGNWEDEEMTEIQTPKQE